MYEIKSVGFQNKGVVQLESYYKVADEIRRLYAETKEPPWRVEYATWYPPHVLPFPTDLNRIVCTQKTDHNLWPGVILYDVRALDDDEQRKRRMQRVLEHRIVDFSKNFTDLLPRISKELAHKVRYFDPQYPSYVIIVPQKFYRDWCRMKSEELIDKMRVKLPPFLDPRHPVGQFRIIGWSMVGMTAGAFAAFYLIVAASLLSSGAAAGAAVGTSAGGAAAGGAEIVSLAAYKAALSSPVAIELAAAAGVLLVLGLLSEAKADKIKIEELAAIRAVPVADFRSLSGEIQAFSEGSTMARKIKRLDKVSSRFNIGDPVKFNYRQHFIIGQVVAKNG
jgi:hypothetical protein